MADLTPTIPEKTPDGYVLSSQCHLLLDQLAAELGGCEEIAAVPVFPEYKGDLWNHLKRVLNAKLGIVASVQMVGGLKFTESAFGRSVEDAHVRVRVSENVLFNQGATGTKISALAYIERALVLLNNFTPSAAVMHNPAPVLVRLDNPFQDDTDEKNEAPGGVVSWVANFQTKLCLQCECAEP